MGRAAGWRMCLDGERDFRFEISDLRRSAFCIIFPRPLKATCDNGYTEQNPNNLLLRLQAKKRGKQEEQF
jgi:hypothetical protein